MNLGKLRAAARKLQAVEPAGPGEELCLLLPEGTPHEYFADIASKLGVNSIRSPHEGKSSMHRRAHQAGHDITGVILYRHRSTQAVDPSVSEHYLRSLITNPRAA